MQSQYTPTHLSIHPPFLTSSWCCYSMVAFQIVRQWHSLGAHQKANEMLVNLSTVAEMWTWSVWHNETVRIASPTGIYTLVKFHAALKKKKLKKKKLFLNSSSNRTLLKRRKKKLTFHYTQIGQYTRCMLPKQFHNVHLLNVDSVNMIFKYNIYRRYNVDLLLYTSTRTRDIYVKCFHL